MFNEREAEAAEDRAALERVRDGIDRVRGKQRVGVKKNQRVARRDFGAAIHLPRAHAVAFENACAARARDRHGPIDAPAIGDDDLRRTRRERRIDGRADARFFVECGDHHAHRHVRMVAYALHMNGYILVGGLSRRMGRSKVELFLDRVVYAARPVFDELVAVHRPDGDPHPSLRTIFEEPHEGMAPIFGIIRALRDANAKCFILGVDYPLLTTEILRALVSRFEHSHCKLLVPMWSGLPQMLCAGYDAALLPELAGRIELKPLIREAFAEVIAEDELRARFAGEPLMNVNTPEELQEAEARYGS